MKPNTTAPDITARDLEHAMNQILAAAGWNPDQIAGFLAAQHRDGLLRDNCPGWKMRSALFIFHRAPALKPPALADFALDVIAAIDPRP